MTAPGRYLISNRSAPTTDERRALTNRADDLRRALDWAEALDIAREILGLMAGYPSVRMNREESARMSAAFVSALAKLPLWAIRKACENWTAGRVPDTNPAFPPNAVQIKIEADRVAAPRRHELGRIAAVLAAEVIRLPTEDERKQAVEHWEQNIRPAMQHADVTEDLGERERNAFIAATRRLLAKELASANVTEGPAMTMDMRRKLGVSLRPARRRKDAGRE